MTAGTASSTCAVCVGTLQYLYYCGIPLQHLDDAIAIHDGSIEPTNFCYLAVICLMYGAVDGLYLLYGPTEAALGFVGFTVFVAIMAFSVYQRER